MKEFDEKIPEVIRNRLPEVFETLYCVTPEKYQKDLIEFMIE